MRAVAVCVMIAVLGAVAPGQVQGDERSPQEMIRELEQRITLLEKQLAELRRTVESPRLSTWEQEIQEVGPAPGPIASTGVPVTDDTRLDVGQVLQVKYGNTWWACKILLVLDGGRVCIHYLGWQSQFDEIVPRARLQLDPDAIAKARSVRLRYAPHPLPINDPPRNPGSITPGPIRVIDNTRLNVGDAVDVQWSSSWWRGEVLAVLPDGRVNIHYVGWSSASDETVARSRLRLSADPGAAARGR